MSDDDSDSEFESLMATRARRSNAGSRLKKLLELEEQNDVSNNQFTTEDDENVNLLFQEEGEDEEFIDEDVDNENLDGIDVDEDDDDIEPVESKKRKYVEDGETSDIDAAPNSDEQLSDSDLSASDTDESEGEKELQKQERVKKRRSKKNVVPAIKKARVEFPIKKKSRTQLITSDSLLLSNRRSSARSAAVESKQALIDRLKESEIRKAKYTHIHKRHKAIELTQEQRLAQAVETEKQNVESLNKFREQEVVKKERQKQILLQKRIKLQNVLRLISKETFIEPKEEVSNARRQWEHYTRIRKRLSKKKLSQLEENELFTSKMPFSIDFDSPYQKALIAERRSREEKRLVDMNDQIKELIVEKVKDEKIENGVIENQTIENEHQDEKLNHDERIDQKRYENEIGNEEIKEELANEVEENARVAVKEEILESQAINGQSKPQNSEDVEQFEESSNHDKDSELQTNTSDGTKTSENMTYEDDKGQMKNEFDVKKQDSTVREGTLTEVKRVTFVDDANGEDSNSLEQTPMPESATGEEIFEGPAQRVGRETICFIDFNEDDYYLTNNNMKRILFGDQAVLPASRRFKDLKTILHIGKIDNPYAQNKPDDKNNLFESVLKLTEEDLMFDELKKLPRLGVKQEFIEEVENSKEDLSNEIVLKTEAPTGLYLPNGNKKNCMISGTEVKYFDPSTGIPYSSVEVYKFLKLVEQGNVPWYSFDEKTNDTGVAELYLGSRDGDTKHAKGVPEGFDN